MNVLRAIICSSLVVSSWIVGFLLLSEGLIEVEVSQPIPWQRLPIPLPPPLIRGGQVPQTKTPSPWESVTPVV